MTMTVDDRQLLAHLDALPEKMKEAARPVIKELTDTMLALVHAAEPRRTGRLIAATRGSVIEGKTYIRGRVRIEGGTARLYAAAAALEYGSHRAFLVRAYGRRSGRVQAYIRRANIEPRRFLRGSAAAIRERALAEIKEILISTARANL
jgi:hypothetical protein